MIDELLTEQEHAVLSTLADAWNLFQKILADGDTRSEDQVEFMIHLHVCQRMVMGQAAARAYPHRYRLLGDVIHSEETP
jgi:hypothetical protein